MNSDIPTLAAGQYAHSAPRMIGSTQPHQQAHNNPGDLRLPHFPNSRPIERRTSHDTWITLGEALTRAFVETHDGWGRA